MCQRSAAAVIVAAAVVAVVVAAAAAVVAAAAAIIAAVAAATIAAIATAAVTAAAEQDDQDNDPRTTEAIVIPHIHIPPVRCEAGKGLSSSYAGGAMWCQPIRGEWTAVRAAVSWDSLNRPVAWSRWARVWPPPLRGMSRA